MKALSNLKKRPETSKKDTKKKLKLKRPTSIRLSMKEKIFFVKRLSFLITAGVPILESLHMIEEQTSSKRFAKVMKNVVSDVTNGQFLSSSLAKFRKTFGELVINVIYVGETSGVLSENLEYLGEELRKKHALKRKVVGAFIYPAIVTAATLAITAFLMVYLFPKLMPVFTSLNVHLPFTTRAIIFLSNFLRDYGLILVGIIALISIAIPILLKNVRAFHFIYDRLILRLPLIGKMIQYYNLANINRTLSLLLKSGITLSEALPMTAKSTPNLVYKKEMDSILEVVNRGEKISFYLKKHRDLFPEVNAHIIAVGERSGSLADSLKYLSEMYEGEVDEFTKNLSNLIEPVLMIFMGLMVGFIAVSIITPIYGITQSLSR